MFEELAFLKLEQNDNYIRTGRLKMIEEFPRPPEFWLEWIDDEIGSGNERRFILKIFELATRECHNVDIWLRYLDYIRQDPNIDAYEIFEMFERAAYEVGSDVQEGHRIWVAYQDYESLAPDKSIWEVTLYNLYLRQFSLPLEGSSDLYRALPILFDRNPDRIKTLTARYEESQNKLNQFRPFEERLKQTNVDYSSNKTGLDESESREDVWLEYLGFVEDNYQLEDIQGNFNNHQIESKLKIVERFYERAITDLCVSHGIWMKYLQFLSRYPMKFWPVTAVYERAVRNCKSSFEVWMEYVRYSEKCGKTVEGIRQIFDQIFSQNLIIEDPFLKIWTAYLDFEEEVLYSQSTPDLTRIRATFNSLFDQNFEEKKIFEAERKAKEEAERKANQEAQRKAKEEAERKANQEAERKAKEEAERKAKEEVERKAKQEAERKAKQEAERKAKEEAERKAKEEVERKAKQEAERKAKDEAMRKQIMKDSTNNKRKSGSDLGQKDPKSKQLKIDPQLKKEDVDKKVKEEFQTKEYPHGEIDQDNV